MKAAYTDIDFYFKLYYNNDYILPINLSITDSKKAEFPE
jgi:hypothetical protein